jgi:hypothetical protein
LEDHCGGGVTTNEFGGANQSRLHSGRPLHRRGDNNGWTLSVGQNEGDLEVDAILCDLAVLHDHLLLLDPRALYILQGLGGPVDALFSIASSKLLFELAMISVTLAMVMTGSLA